MGKVLGLSGRMQSGKNTCANFLIGLYMQSLNLIEIFKITDKGELWISDIEGNKNASGVLDVTANNKHVRAFCADKLDDYIKLYSFADFLKKNVCMDIFGLTYKQCYGTNEDKDTLTDLNWEHMPGVIVSDKVCQDLMKFSGPKLNEWVKNKVLYHPPGKMTAREVLQYVGTNIFRKMYPDVWVHALIRQIELESSDISIIVDVRFPNEVRGIRKIGGKVLRFKRNPLNNTHDSETALDRYYEFDFMIDNREMNISEQNKSVYECLYPLGFIPVEVVNLKI